MPIIMRGKGISIRTSGGTLINATKPEIKANVDKHIEAEKNTEYTGGRMVQEQQMNTIGKPITTNTYHKNFVGGSFIHGPSVKDKKPRNNISFTA
jgi:hypothetical protein